MSSARINGVGKYAPLPTDFTDEAEKKGTTKTRRQQVFRGLSELRMAGKKVFLGVSVVQGFYAFCDIFLRRSDGTSARLRHYPSLEQHMKKVTNHHKT